ncbi:hypothetical protein [Salinimicrobium terrae]|uniref:hypothetical protein n=1 Tax=Salinimicrobium terrae TaxID=470866 RepID=UPI000410EA29|nr:hypothetical protein [Salinimicrobium terrae]
MNTIRQRKGFESRAYTLDPESDFIEVEFNTIKEKLKYKIHLTEVGTDIQYQADNVLIGKIFWGLSTAIAAFSTAYYFLGNPEDPGTYVANSIIWGVISICGIFFTAKDDLLITNGNKLITLFRNEEEALEFANNLIKKANEKKKEMLINFDLSEDQFNANIHWLHSMRMIDKTELAQLQADFNIKKLI